MLWGAADDIHMVMIATFSVAAAGVPTIMELSLMPVTRQWLPVEDGFEKQLVERLVGDGRSFVKGLRYNLEASSVLASATLTDCDDAAPTLFIVPAGIDSDERYRQLRDSAAAVRLWHRSSEAIPALPPHRRYGAEATKTAVESQ